MCEYSQSAILIGGSVGSCKNKPTHYCHGKRFCDNHGGFKQCSMCDTYICQFGCGYKCNSCGGKFCYKCLRKAVLGTSGNYKKYVCCGKCWNNHYYGNMGFIDIDKYKKALRKIKRLEKKLSVEEK